MVPESIVYVGLAGPASHGMGGVIFGTKETVPDASRVSPAEDRCRFGLAKFMAWNEGSQQECLCGHPRRVSKLD